MTSRGVSVSNVASLILALGCVLFSMPPVTKGEQNIDFRVGCSSWRGVEVTLGEDSLNVTDMGDDITARKVLEAGLAEAIKQCPKETDRHNEVRVSLDLQKASKGRRCCWIVAKFGWQEGVWQFADYRNDLAGQLRGEAEERERQKRRAEEELKRREAEEAAKLAQQRQGETVRQRMATKLTPKCEARPPRQVFKGQAVPGWAHELVSTVVSPPITVPLYELTDLLVRHDIAAIANAKVWYAAGLKPCMTNMGQLIVAYREITSVDYTNRYQKTMSGTPVEVFALRFTYRLMPTVPFGMEAIALASGERVERAYEGKTQLYLDPSEGRWKVLDYHLAP